MIVIKESDKANIKTKNEMKYKNHRLLRPGRWQKQKP